MSDSKSTGPFALYWENYGGWRALWKSGYLWAALGLTVVCYPLWTHEGWWDDVVSIAPSMIGFSLAAFAMLLAFTNERFLKVVTTAIPNVTGGFSPSTYSSTSTAFVHFIVVQILALLAALVCKACFVVPPHWMLSSVAETGISQQSFIAFTKAFWFIAYWLFLYSILCGLAATFRVFLLSHWFEKVARLDAKIAEQAAAEQVAIKKVEAETATQISQSHPLKK